jgi:hypothetical protein
MQKIEHGTARLSTAEALAFWVFLGAMTMSAVYGLGRVIQAASERASSISSEAFALDGLWQGRTEIARVSSSPDGIDVLLWQEHGSRLRFEQAYHFLRTVGSAVTYVGADGRSNAIWERHELRLNLPGRHLVLNRW